MTALFSEAHSLTGTPHAVVALGLFVVAYLLVVFEERIHLRKSKPVMGAAGVMWILTALAYHYSGGTNDKHIEERVMHLVAEYGALFLFLMVAMSYISAIAKHNVFLRINAWLVSAGFGLRAVFWTTGTMAFFISPIADNLTTALLMGTVAVTVGRGNPAFICAACTNIVVAANAGGAWSPFGDITTLMVWTANKVSAGQFLQIFVPSLANWLVPAVIMSLFVPKTRPEPLREKVVLKDGWLVVVVLFLLTIGTAITFHMALHLPPFLGMTTGLTYYFIYGYLRLHQARRNMAEPLDVFHDVASVEWDTLLFFFGVIMCVGSLGELGYLAEASTFLYQDLGPTWANVGVGLLSAVIDNVPVMFAVLTMDPAMGTTPDANIYQWCLVTLTAGVGGSLLSVGSAAGVALMGAARGHYTFMGHLKWAPAIALGYALSIVLHWLLNAPPAPPPG